MPRPLSGSGFLMPLSRTLRIVILIAAVLILLATLSLVPLEAVPAWGWDVSVFRAASRALMAGENPYQPENIPPFAAGSELATIPYYVYAPFFAVGFIPFALLPPDWTSRLWFLANLALVVASAG
ncbi:MAG TPA: hypothetical protein VFI11_04855, partial [Anaerolineales bacterium]|nr:hypothetical protein [Anaerolineales bacterium]